MPSNAPARFDRIAANFATSEVHRTSPTMHHLHALLDLPPGAAVCDVACGAGHLALSFAERAGRIVAVDPAPNMLAVCARMAAERDVPLETVLAHAETIPLPTGTFHAVLSRLAPHHFADIEAAVREMARLARPGGWVAVIDLEGHPDPDIDAFNHFIEVLHDPTHVRSYTAQRWRELFEGAGLTVEVLEPRQRESVSGVPVKRWCEIASSGVAAEEAIRAALRAAPPHYLEELDIREVDGEFYIPVRTVLIAGRRLREDIPCQ